MKTLAIALFASLTLFGCATDEQDLEPIDRGGELRDVESVTDDLGERAGDTLVPEGVGISEQGQRWAEELIVDSRLWTIIHGPRGVEGLLDDRGLKVPAPQGFDALLDELRITRSRTELQRIPE